MKTYAVIAAYNEEQAIGDVVSGVADFATKVVVTDDGSRDRTGERAVEAGATVLTHVINRGQGAALKTGIDYALASGADVIVTFDADGQFLPEEIPRMIAPIEKGRAQISLGSRFKGEANVPSVRRLILRGGILFTRLLSGIGLSDAHNGFRAMTAQAASRIAITQDRMAHSSQIIDEISRLGIRHEEVPVTVRYTEYSMAKGQSSLNAVKIARDFILGKILKRYRA